MEAGCKAQADLIRPSHGPYTCHLCHILLLRTNHGTAHTEGEEYRRLHLSRGGVAENLQPSLSHYTDISGFEFLHLPWAGCVILGEFCELS